MNILQCKLRLENGFTIEVPMREDGYIFATAMMKAVGKRLGHWRCSPQTNKHIQYVIQETGLTEDQLIVATRAGNKYKQGTWIHRKLATNLAMWCSSYFVYQVCGWIEEWISASKINETKYLKEISNIRTDDSCDSKEKEIQLRLHRELGGEIEVESSVGFIDLLTDTEIIEIKTGSCWKHAVGQVLMYALDYPKHRKRIHLFDIEPSDTIREKCDKYDIVVTYERCEIVAADCESKEELDSHVTVQTESDSEDELLLTAPPEPTTKRCGGQCHDTEESRLLPLENFFRNASNRDGYARLCKECYLTGEYGDERKRRKVVAIPKFEVTTHKWCNLCEAVKVHNDFPRDSTKKDGLNANCKECRSKHKKDLKNKRKAEEKAIAAAAPPPPPYTGPLKRCEGKNHETEESRMLPLTDFYTKPTNKDGLTKLCKKCYLDGKPKKDIPDHDKGTHKWCNTCDKVKERAEFYVQSHKPGGLKANCKECCTKESRESRK